MTDIAADLGEISAILTDIMLDVGTQLSTAQAKIIKDMIRNVNKMAGKPNASI